MTHLQVATFNVSPPVRDLLTADRERGHVHVMSAFRRGLGADPRGQLGLLWHVDVSSGTLTVQSHEPPVHPGLLGQMSAVRILTCPEGGDTVELVVERSCQRTPRPHLAEALRAELERRGPDGRKIGKAYRSRQIVVPESERLEWALGRLRAIGADVDGAGIRVGPVRFAGLGNKRRGIPYVEIRARVRVSSPEEFCTAVSRGIGKGKNYGLGLIRLRAHEAYRADV